MKTLVIVESPAKAKTIEKYLGPNYKVMSSVGHIRDLATSGPGGLGIDIEKEFEPTYKYITGKKKIVNELIKEKNKSIDILIATDPDREGEAIGWHLIESLELDYNLNNRIVFNEITKSGITQGIKNKRKLDLDLVNSQESRRIIDRIIGFKLSSLLKKKIKVQSAGRVQSVALRMIVQREEEIEKFVAKEYWTLHAQYKKLDLEYKKNKDQLEMDEIEKVFNSLKNDNELIVKNLKKSKKKQKPYRIFTTSTMQQTAVSTLGFSSKKTMSVAQSLYQGVDVGSGLEGLITYMRTDSTRISIDFEKEAYKYIEKKYGENYIGKYFQKSNKGSQDAHEGIRPTNILNSPTKIKNFLTADEFKLYNLIWKRSIQALMKDAEIETTTYTFEHESNVEFKISCTKVIFDGFRILDATTKKEDFSFELGEKIKVDIFDKKQHFTQPKPRYSEAKLIKELEENGVGRPSTYASIIDILKKRNYVIVDKKVFFPTDDGRLVTEKLREYFKTFIDVGYTAKLEEELDDIAQGTAEKLKVLNEFYNYFEPLLKNANENMKQIDAQIIGRKCPECDLELVQRKSKYGEFIGCSNFPKCKYNEIEQKSYGKCKKCGTGEIVEKKTKRGKKFYACNNYPKCKFAVWELKELEV